MADDLNQVVNKMWKSTEGQSPLIRDRITVTNSVDYSKWNNHQRGEANDPVFKVIGQFYGLPQLFTRTHEFFSKSLIYYKARPDLMRVVDGQLESQHGLLLCWNGQPGGLEGLRQKGWSIVNLLCLEREATQMSTAIHALAQGDNQIISCYYKVESAHSDAERIHAYQDIIRNNDEIMDRIRKGTTKLGFIVNEDETMQSMCMMIYGKVMIINGLFYSLTAKRLSRVLGATNDQFSNMGSIHASVVTNVLTVCHYSSTSLPSMHHYNWLGNFSRLLTEQYNPDIRAPMREYTSGCDPLEYRIRYLYLDPSLGGVSGLSLTRMIVRQFPDPVTEGLVFWKVVWENGPNELKKIAERAGSPNLLIYRPGGNPETDQTGFEKQQNEDQEPDVP